MVEHTSEYRALLTKQQDYVESGALNIEQRKATLLRLKQMLTEHEQELINALVTDTKRPEFEAYSFELALLLNEIDFVYKHLNKWTRIKRSFHLKFGYIESIRKKRSPYGSVLIISPWNYPLQLALMPAISAIAAGNCCVIKPSEYAPATGELLAKLIATFFSPQVIAVITGDRRTAELLTTLPFKLIFFTGSERTGKVILQQAATQLTPVILELGGKNPCILDQSFYSPEAVREIVWGKFLNAGQTCIAPDTLYVNEAIYEQVLLEIAVALTEFYGENVEDSQDYSRICHIEHFNRLMALINQGKVRTGGSYTVDDLFIAPTVLTDIQPGSPILSQEIFGPILPVIPYKRLEDLLEQGVLQRDALVAYIFSTNEEHIQLIATYMHSTAISVNEVIHHAANPHVSFGGIGRSGQGSYHGKAGLYAFSYDKTEYRVHPFKKVNGKFPPYSDMSKEVVKKLRKWLL